IVAQRSSAASSPLTVPLAVSAPGIFTSDGSGRGQAAAVNQDGSPNSAATPAPSGSVIALYITGEGQATLGLIAVTIGDRPAQVQSAGTAIIVAPVFQINAVVPVGISGQVPIVVTIGGVATQPGVTIAVR